MTSPETTLWRAVILQAIEDAEAPPTTAERKRQGDQALAWFGGRDFHAVCAMADINPEVVMRRLFGDIRRKAA